MHEFTVHRTTWISFVVAIGSIVCGVILGILGVWEIIPTNNGLLWRLLASDGIIFVGAVLTNLAVACYQKPGGAVLNVDPVR